MTDRLTTDRLTTAARAGARSTANCPEILRDASDSPRGELTGGHLNSPRGELGSEHFNSSRNELAGGSP